MPKVYHDMKGPTRPARSETPARATPAVIERRREPGLWKYPGWPRAPGMFWLAIFISLNTHLLLLFGFNQDRAPESVAVAGEDPVIQIAMPDLKDLDEEKPVEELNDAEAEPDPGVAVPTLADVPSIVPMDAFTQKVDYQPAVQTDLGGPKLTSIPVKIARGAGLEKLGKIFDLSQLDRAPEPIVQTPPLYPSNLKREYPEAKVTVGFVVNIKGEVVAPYVVASTYFGFEQAALEGVEKWKFRPGVKNGHKVNARMQVDINFTLKEVKPG